MSKMEHTPGPWLAEKREGRVYVMSRGVKHPRANGASWHDVAYLCTTNGCDIDDGRLIAAAPDMLDCLYAIKSTVHFESMSEPLQKQINTAIAKTEEA